MSAEREREGTQFTFYGPDGQILVGYYKPDLRPIGCHDECPLRDKEDHDHDY